MKQGDVVWAHGEAWMLTKNSECRCCKVWTSGTEVLYGSWSDELEGAKDYKWIVKDGVLL